jgi:competence protein ComEC
MTPLVRSTLAYMAGLVVPFYLVPDISTYIRWGWAPVAVAAAVALLLVRASRAAGRYDVPLQLFVLLGVFAGGAARNRSNADCRSRIEHSAAVQFVGQPASLPGTDGGFTIRLIDAQTAGAGSAAEAVGAVATVGAVRFRCAGMVRAKMPKGAAPELGDGRALVGSGVWLSFESSTRLPVPPERRGMLLIRSVAAAPATVPTSHMLTSRTHAQRTLRAMLKQSGLAEALVLAQREGVDREVNDRFAATGLSHLLSISGTHVGLVAALLLGTAAFLRIGGSAGRIGATVGVVAYVLFLGAPAAAARSAIQVVLLLSGRMLQRPSEPYSVLAAAALALLVVQPLNLLDAGFQLSFAGVIGLIAYHHRIAEKLPRKLPKWLRDGLAASVAASGVTIPIAAIHFGQVAPIGVPASIIAVPLVGLALPAVALVLLLAGIAPPLAHFFAAGADLLLLLVDRVAAVAMAVPGGHAPLASSSLLALLAVAAAVVLMSAWQRERDRTRTRDAARRGAGVGDGRDGPDWRDRRAARRWRLATYAAAVLATVAWAPQVMALYGSGAVEIHAIDVGQGDALAIRTPHGHWILVDTGPRTPRFDAGRSRVVPYLLDHGARRLDALVLTHPDADHIGGAATVLAVMGAAAVIDPGTAAGKPLYLQTMASADSSSAVWYKARDGRHLDVDGVRLDFLYPASDSLDGNGDANDLSVAFRLRFGSFAALFMGDAPVATEDRIVAEYGSRLASAVLKVGHHGSYTSTSESFLTVVHPSLALVSVGRDNRYGHPNPGVMARLVRHRVRVLRTDQHGALVVTGRTDGGYSVATQR